MEETLAEVRALGEGSETLFHGHVEQAGLLHTTVLLAATAVSQKKIGLS